MNDNTIYEETYKIAFEENRKITHSWTDYKDNLQELRKNMEFYPKKLSHRVMVPLGKKAMVRGKLTHTNEVLIRLDSEWFVKKSATGAIEVCDRLIKRCDTELEALKKEENLLVSNSEMAFENPCLNSEEQVKILESVTEEEENAWKEKHRKKVKEYKQKLNEMEPQENIKSEEDLMKRLNELELLEELEEELEMLGSDNEVSDDDSGTFAESWQKLDEPGYTANWEEQISQSVSMAEENRNLKNRIPVEESGKRTTDVKGGNELKAKDNVKSQKKVSFANDDKLEEFDEFAITDASVPCIYFKHSPQDEHPSKKRVQWNDDQCQTDPDEITTPTDIYKKFVKTQRSKELPKSILKRNESYIPSDVPFNGDIENNVIEEFPYYEPCGDIVERNPEFSRNTQKPSKTASKFKASRKKSR